MKHPLTCLIFGLLAAQAATGLVGITRDATLADLASRKNALTAPALERLDLALGDQAELFHQLAAALAPFEGHPTVVYLFPSEGLPTDLGELAVLQNRFGTPLAALLQPASVRILNRSLDPGPLLGDEALFVAEIGPRQELPFMKQLEELARGDDFRIFKLPKGTKH